VEAIKNVRGPAIIGDAGRTVWILSIAEGIAAGRAIARGAVGSRRKRMIPSTPPTRVSSDAHRTWRNEVRAWHRP
jgi:hypothetical protein